MSHKITLEEIEVRRLVDTQDDARDELIGRKLVEVLGLKIDNKTQRIETSWGNKSYIGLTRTVQSILSGKN